MSVQRFRKTGNARQLAAERAGLAALAATATVRVPAYLNHGSDWMELEFLDLRSPTVTAHRELGTQLAAMHHHTGPAHGWEHDNFIGLAPQPNGMYDDWEVFFIERRLGYQLGLARQNGHEVDAPLDRLAALLDHRPEPSLLHGDLWAGNHGMLPDGTPVLFDPAVHFGDRECDLAMTALFGGFAHGFNEAYTAAWPLPEGWERRRPLYQLYHALNHLNLFGAGYLGMVRHLLALILGHKK